MVRMTQVQSQKLTQPFLWGAATASYQVEGGIETCDWAKAGREGKVPVAGDACDHYRLFREDFALAKSLGHTAHRFSIEWARIEPEEGVFDEREIEHYREVLRALHEEGMVPFITLWHFTVPSWFADSGGWERADAPHLFARYCAYVVEHLKDLCNHFDTMNEPTVYASNGWVRGTWPPFKKFSLVDHVHSLARNPLAKSAQNASPLNVVRYFQVLRTLARGHREAYRLVKAQVPDVELGIVHNVIVYRAGRSPVHKLMAHLAHYAWTGFFMARVKDACDSIGVNYYFYKKFGDTRVYEKTDTHWDRVPEHLCEALRDVAGYGKPLYVTEAGCADARDAFRAEYIRASVKATLRARDEGIDVRGFFYWSLLDNYEWALGYAMRFGLVEVDYDNKTRTIRPSAEAYRDIIAKERV
jgi:beta-glucosidase